MQTFDAMCQRRSIRKFRPEPVAISVLKEIVEVSRLYPSGGNLQPVRFAIVTREDLRDAIFAGLKWAMYLPDYIIADTEQPTAYIILLRDDTIKKKCDYDIGAASTMVMLGAVEKGLASCPIGNFSATQISALLNLPENLHPELVLALGYPAQESCVTPMANTVHYAQDEQGDFLVPKWSTEEVTAFCE